MLLYVIIVCVLLEESMLQEKIGFRSCAVNSDKWHIALQQIRI